MTARYEDRDVRVDLDDIGEGLNGDYNPDDPNDIPLMRFYVFKYDPDHHYDEYNTGWVEVDNASYCTQIRADTPQDILEQLAQYIWEAVVEQVLSDHSIKKLCEQLYWISPIWLDREL